MGAIKVCPLCREEFDSDVEVCPTDGCVLLEDDEDSGVRLSNETEKLLGNILDTDRTERVRPGVGFVTDGLRRTMGDDEDEPEDEDDEEEVEETTVIGPPPAMPEGYVESDAFGPPPGLEDDEHGETTVIAPMDHIAEAKLEKPLASLEVARLPSASLDEEVTTDDAAILDDDEDDDDTTVIPPLGSIGGRARVFQDLAMEFDQLETDLDGEVTQRVFRDEEEKTRRSEMPPEFMEVLEREDRIPGAISGEHTDSSEGSYRDTVDVSVGPSMKVEVDPSLSEEASDLEFEVPEKPKRALPRPSQLQVQQVVMQIGRPKRPLGLMVALGVLTAVLVWLLVVAFF